MGDVCASLGSCGKFSVANISSTQRRNRSEGRRNQMEKPSIEFNSLCLKHDSNVTTNGVKEGGKTVLGIQSLTRDPRANTVWLESKARYKSQDYKVFTTHRSDLSSLDIVCRTPQL